jgi:nucleotide-binding universal stress UspA family protein
VPRDVRFSNIKKIGLACDFDNVVHTIPTDELRLLVKDFGAVLHVLNTGKRTEFDPEVVFESGLLQEMIVDLKPEYHFITHDDVDKGILDFVDQNHIDLLIVLPKRRQLLEKLIHRSHTRQFVLHSHVPVMALH